MMLDLAKNVLGFCDVIFMGALAKTADGSGLNEV